jgi:hypothetical protein
MDYGGSPDFSGINSEGKVVPVQTRLQTTAKYIYTDNRFGGINYRLFGFVGTSVELVTPAGTD